MVCKPLRRTVAVACLLLWCIPMFPFLVIDAAREFFGWLADRIDSFQDWIDDCGWARPVMRTFDRHMVALKRWVDGHP